MKNRDEIMVNNSMPIAPAHVDGLTFRSPGSWGGDWLTLCYKNQPHDKLCNNVQRSPL